MTLHPRMAQRLALEDLIGDVGLLCLDAGNTVVFFDHGRLATLRAREGHLTTAAALVDAEGRTKLALERGEALDPVWSQAHVPAARGWAATVGTTLAFAGLPARAHRPVLDVLWREHIARNLWSLVPAGLVEALDGSGLQA